MQYTKSVGQPSPNSSGREDDQIWLGRLLLTLRQSAARELSRYLGQLTWQPTAIVNEAVVKVWNSKLIQSGATRRQVMVALSQAIHDVAVDEHRRRMTSKRGNGVRPLVLPDDYPGNLGKSTNSSDPIDVKWAMERLERARPRQAEVIRLRFFGGFTCPEIAEALDVSLSTIESELREGRGRLYAFLQAGHAPRERSPSTVRMAEPAAMVRCERACVKTS
ncbi:hypothetical protein C2E31_23260 [Rhodopirellula baltica]|nr:hypothetical protein C2E31_23260 [Rhodopirellula baltica]